MDRVDGADSGTSSGLLGRMADGVCRRAFSAPEAFAYETTIAPAVARVVGPAIRSRVSARRALDVGCGGGLIATSIASDRAGTVLGVDPSASQVRRFTRRTSACSRIWAITARAEALPFGDDEFDAVYSSCAWKHWPDPRLSLAECVRVARAGGGLVIVEIDGASTETEFRQFARTSRVPPGLRNAYVRFAMRTVVGVAPDASALARSFDGLAVTLPTIERIGTLPFLMAATTVL
jgi:ubiquinone/menaquinone biosynthesis C-methylase UbiE